MSDRLALANAIEDAGINRAKAERVASVIVDMIYGPVATKADVEASEGRLRAEIAGVRAEASSFREEVAREFGSVRADIAALRGEIALMESRLLIRLGGLIVVVVGAAFTALHYWPPGH